jgi:hypothetical protein
MTKNLTEIDKIIQEIQKDQKKQVYDLFKVNFQTLTVTKIVEHNLI